MLLQNEWICFSSYQHGHRGLTHKLSFQQYFILYLLNLVNYIIFCWSLSDFSGRSGPQQMKGYVTKTEYEMLGDGMTKETPQNKFNRLQHEIRELAEELEQIKVCFNWVRCYESFFEVKSKTCLHQREPGKKLVLLKGGVHISVHEKRSNILNFHFGFQ